MDDVESALQATVGERHSERITAVEDVKTIPATVEDGDVVRFSYCGSESCGTSIESTTAGEILGTDLRVTEEGRYVERGEKTETIGYLAKRL